MRQFQEAHGSILCRELIGCDVSTPEGYQAAADKRVFVTICPALVSQAAEIVAGLLESARS